MMTTHPTNEAIAQALEALANRLAERGANPHRVQAYHTAVESVRAAETSLVGLLDEGGTEALQALPGIGTSIASRIAGFVETGHLVLLEQIRDEFVPERLFTRVFGIGPELARRIHAELGVESLEDLELAAYDGRLEGVEGIGPQRIQALRAQLDVLLRQRSRRRAERLRRPAERQAEQPSVRLLLDVDREYRTRAARKELRRIAPRRFNPSGQAWLPVLNTYRGIWRTTALFSNTPRAHELGKTDDWVVIYAEREGHERQQYTVVTETRGPLRGSRVVRGREAECRMHYEGVPKQAA